MGILGLKPFLSFYGSKWRIAPKYPRPMFKTIVEPFAGGAGYSCRYPAKNVVLCEIDPIIYGIWKYLIGVSESEIRLLPVDIPCTDVLSGVPQEAKWLIGFWMCIGLHRPRKSQSTRRMDGMHTSRTWSATIRERIASQLQYIRHWKVVHSSWHHIEQYVESKKVTWFIDPPYSSSAGREYKYNYMNYRALARWAQGLDGQVIVCEEKGADWLPFKELTHAVWAGGRGRRGSGMEMIWTNNYTTGIHPQTVKHMKKTLPRTKKKLKSL